MPLLIVVLVIVAGGAGFAALVWREQAVIAVVAAAPPWLRSRGWALLLLPVALCWVLVQRSLPWLLLVALLLVVFAPRAATRLLPLALLGLGAMGFWIARYGNLDGGHYGLVPVGWYMPQSRWLVPEAALFLAAGAWLFQRLDAPGSGLIRALVGRLRGGAGGPWALLILPVIAMVTELFGLAHWFGMGTWPTGYSIVADLAIAAAGLILALRWPARAAAAMLVGLVFLGAYGILLAMFWPSIPGGFFGAVVVSSRPTAVVGGLLQGAALLAAATWLAPRIYRDAPDPELAARAEQLTVRVETLTQTRTDAVDTAAAELRRIERDLHDGAQARLVALGMSLQAAERLFTTSPEAALALVSEAKEASSRALTELRDLVRGIYPPVLADRGLGDAIKALALDTPLHTVVDVDLPAEIDLPVGSAVYFAVAEALANAAKHSGARTVRIHLSHARDVLRAQVTDDGAGGADPANGTGLTGVERRLATFDGILAVNSPPGGPTIVVIEVPCALSSPKTSSC